MTAGSARHTTTSSAAVADLAEGGRARADRLEGEARPAPPPGSTIAPTASASADRLALRLDARLPEAVDERRPRLAAGSRPRRPPPRRRSPRGPRCWRRARPPARRTTRRRARTSASRSAARRRRSPRCRRRRTRTRRTSRQPPAATSTRGSSSARSRAACSSRLRERCLAASPRRPRRVQIGCPAAMRSPGCGTSRTPALQPADAVADDHVLGGEEHRLAGRARGLALDPRQLAGARPQVRAEHAHAVRRLDRLERGRGTRVDLDRPRALAVPDEVDAEQPAQRERARQARADRARLPQQVCRARRRAGAAGRRSRTSGSRARRTPGARRAAR